MHQPPRQEQGVRMTRLVSPVSAISATRPVYGFLAAVMATLIFYRIGLLLLHFAGMTPGMPCDTRPTPPFGVSRVISLAFWGGLWGIVFVLAERYIAQPGRSLGRGHHLRRNLSSHGSSSRRSKACRSATASIFPACWPGGSLTDFWVWERQ